MKLLLLSRSSNAGGGPRWSETLARGLSARGHSVRVVFTWLGDGSTVFHSALQDLVHEPLCYRKFDPTYPKDLAAFIDASGVDRILIDNHERLQEVVPHCERLQTRKAKVFFIAHCHGCPASYLEAIDPLLSGVICVSESSAETIRRFSPTVIRNGVYPPPSNGEDVRARMGIL